MDEHIKITIVSGTDKNGRTEPIGRVDIRGGEVVGIVGPTGSGKTSLINDIEQLAQVDTVSRRRILVNDEEPDPAIRTDPRRKMVAQLSQNMHFLADLEVGEFLRMHSKSRGRGDELVPRVVALANTLCGEPVEIDHHLTALSGGQSRALMTADIALISDSPIVLIDEIENAGIKKQEALRTLSGEGKIVIVVTHDPVLALLAGRRVVMQNGSMAKILEQTEKERAIYSRLAEMDCWMHELREDIRNGHLLGDYT